MKPHFEILNSAAKRNLPFAVNQQHGYDLAALGELCDGGFISATFANSADGPTFIQPNITIKGREYLVSLTTRTSHLKHWGLNAGKWLATAIAAPVIISWLKKTLLG